MGAWWVASHRRAPVRCTGVVLPPFQELVDAHWRDVARLAYVLAGPADAEDCTQRAWEQALAAYPSLRHAGNLRGWLMTITARAATDGHRTRARRAVPVGELPEASRPVGAGAPAELGAGDGLDPRLRAGLAGLPQRQRVAVVLRYVADLDHAGIAAALGTTPTATRRLVSDGLAGLRAWLNHDVPEGGTDG